MKLHVCTAIGLLATLLVGCEGRDAPRSAPAALATAAPATEEGPSPEAPRIPPPGSEASRPDPSSSLPLSPLGEAPRAAEVVSSLAISGEVAGAPRGTLVCLVRPDAGARDLLALADTVVDAASVDEAGRYRLLAVGDAPRGYELLISAPGKALTRAPLAGSVRLEPEARVDVQLAARASGESEDLAMALVLDDKGRVLPLPAGDLVSDAGGRLSVARLPAGSYELLVASPDLTRCARLEVSVSAGEQQSVELSLEENFKLAQRFLGIVRGPDVGVLSDGEVR
jgi:hypothetical protein